MIYSRPKMLSNTDWREALAIQRHGATLLSSLQDLRDARSSLVGRHAIEIAWKQMKLDGVISLGDIPVAYVRRVKEYDKEQESDLHRLHWLNSTAPLLFVVDNEALRTYSARPQKPGELEGKQACIQVLDLINNALEVEYLLEHIRSGVFFYQHKDQFRPNNGADRRLLSQLRSTRDALWCIDKSIELSEYHSLLVRVLFLRYLQDRSILDGEFFSSYMEESDTVDLLDYLKKRTNQPQAALANLFSELAHRLGIRELQDTSRSIETGPFAQEHFDLIARFLRDEDVGSGRLSLGKWKYDLSLLPVELISAVYQEFIYDEVPTAKRDLGLVPTPRFLAEAVLSIAFENLHKKLPRVLDPACGSGIFLVGCFNRLAHEWRKANDKAPALKTYRGLKNILSQSLEGVELKETACELARLNLLHALLNQVQNQSLRTIMRHADLRPGTLLPATSIHAKSFFDPSLEIKQHSFDLVVGNPPWSKEKIPGWKERYPERLCPERGNLVYAFCWAVGDYLEKHGHACLLLDGKAMLFAPPARHFYDAWFHTTSIDLIVDLAAFRAVLFLDAGRSAAIFRFKPAMNIATNEPPTTIRYLTPWPTGVTSQGGLLDLSDSKVEVLRVSEVRHWAERQKLPGFFRTRLYGTKRDQSLIDRFRSLSTLKEGHWQAHQGFNRLGTNRAAEERELVLTVPFLPTSSKNIWAGWLPVASHTRNYGEKANETPMIRQWPVDERIFTGKRVVLHHTPLQFPPMVRAAYTDVPFTFHKEILGIYSNKATADDLRLLAGILMSELAYYIFFHTSLSWGIEAQPQLRQNDIMAFPWKSPNTTQEKELAHRIAHQIFSLETCSKDEYPGRLEFVRKHVSSLVMDYYELNDWDRDLVSDCISTTSDVAFHGGRKPANVKLAEYDDCLAYVERFSKALQAWSPTRESIGGTAFLSKEAQMGVVLMKRNSKVAFEALEDDDELSKVLGRLKQILHSRQHRGTSSDLMVVAENCLYIAKPLGLRYWTRSAALNDADALAAVLVRQRH